MTNENIAPCLYVDVSLNVPVEKSFTYSVPKGIKNPPQMGARAEVTLSGRRVTGIITALHSTMPASCAPFKDKIKSIKRVIDDTPLLTGELLDLAHWMASYYLCSYGEVLCAMVPTGRREAASSSFIENDIICDEQLKEGNVCLSSEQEAAVNGITQKIIGARMASAASSKKINTAEDNLAKASSISNNAFAAQNMYHYLYGPTGSGKTEVFLSAAERIMKQGKGVIYLVPEIGLTPQVERAVKKRFGNNAALLHSALTGSERLMQWRRIMRQEARIVIGARSAVFAPHPNLGLIIIDEEHDSSYKSSNTPRYHARQVAMRRAQVLGIPLVMGSATPSVESWYAIESGNFNCHRLTKRLSGGVMPVIECIDLRTSPKETTCFSRALVKEVRKTLAAKRQVILFLNRRGFTHYFRCMNCGYELECPNCSVTMTYHKAENRLRCHYCGHTAIPLQMCPKCGSLDIGYSGFGTEAVEAEAHALFPNARIERADADSVSKKHTLEDTLSRFRSGKCDILLGTQMVAKGLNFPGLSLVGVMLADTSLHFPDFRAAERTFSLVTQVSGRAGRYFPDGRVIVQTYSAAMPAISFAVHSDVPGFYKWEIDQRRMTGFPPFSRLIRVVFRSINEKDATEGSEEGAAILHKMLDSGTVNGEYGKENNPEKPSYGASKIMQSAISNGEVTVLGPAQCPLYKIARNYRTQLLLRGAHIEPLQAAARKMLAGIRKKNDVFIEIDVDPVSML